MSEISWFHPVRVLSLSILFSQALVAEQESKDSGGASIAEQVLSIMEIILDEANAEISEDKVRIGIRSVTDTVEPLMLSKLGNSVFGTADWFVFCRATCC